MRVTGFICTWVTANITVTTAAGQGHQPGHGEAKHKASQGTRMPLMHTPVADSPWQSFQHLRRGNEMLIQISPRGLAAKQERRYGPGRRIAAVLVPTGLRRTAATLFSIRLRDSSTTIRAPSIGSPSGTTDGNWSRPPALGRRASCRNGCASQNANAPRPRSTRDMRRHRPRVTTPTRVTNPPARGNHADDPPPRSAPWHSTRR